MNIVRAKTYDELLDDLVAAQGKLENLRIRCAVGNELQMALQVANGALLNKWASIPWGTFWTILNDHPIEYDILREFVNANAPTEWKP